MRIGPRARFGLYHPLHTFTPHLLRRIVFCYLQDVDSHLLLWFHNRSCLCPDLLFFYFTSMPLPNSQIMIQGILVLPLCVLIYNDLRCLPPDVQLPSILLHFSHSVMHSSTIVDMLRTRHGP